MFSLAFKTFNILLYVILFAGYQSLSLLLSFFIRSGFYMKAYCTKETGEKIIALTFDDGPSALYTPVILDILKDKATATFFFIGRKMEGNEGIIKRTEEEGHLIGTHSWSHSNWFDLFSSSRMKDEFIRTEQKIIEITGKKPLLFRPPYGVINPFLQKALKSFNYHVIGFSNRPWDATTKNEEKILHRLVRKLKPGDVVLLHDSVPRSVPVLEEFLKIVQEKGYKIVSLSEMFNIQPYA